MFTDQALAQNEALKTYQTPDDLGKAYLDLHGKVSAGDVSLISEDLRKDPSLSTFKNVNDIAKSYVETKKLVGSIKHAPAKPEEYKFTPVQNTHPGLKMDGIQKFLAGQLHALDIDGERADKLQQAITMALDKGLKDNDAAREAKGKEVETALRSEWKENYDKNKDAIEKILQRAGAPDLAKLVSGDATSLKAINKITSLLSEDSIGKLGDAGSQNITEKGAAQARIQDMIKEQWHLKKGGDYEKSEAEWKKMHEVAYGA